MESESNQADIERTVIKSCDDQSESLIQTSAAEHAGDSPKEPGNPEIEGQRGEQGDSLEENTVTDIRKEAPEASLQKSENVTTSDPYFYLKRDEFTSEIFKIELSNLPQKFGFGQLKKRLLSLNLKPNKIKAMPYKTFAYITFRCEEDREKALKELQGHVWRGATLTVKKANPAADPLQKKRKDNNEQGESSPSKRTKMAEEDDVPWDVKLKNSVTPLWEMEYEQQLKVKTDIIRELLKKIGRQMDTQCPQLRPWLREQRSATGGLCCELLPILRSPVLTGYRNKCEFTLGSSPEGQEKTLGFRLGKYRGGTSSVGEPHDCGLLSEKMKPVVKVFQQYFKASKYAAFDPETHAGNWRQLTVREARSGEIMAFPEFHPQEVSEEDIDSEVKFLQEYFTSGEGKDSGITSMFFSLSTERITGTGSVPTRHVFGEKHITEDLLELKFRISPDAFFQVNTPAAEVLYNTVADWCNPSPTTTVLDICCGTGTIGQCMSKRVGKVIGVEMIAAAVEDARENAKRNGIENVEYICGKAEDVMPGVMSRLSWNKDVVAIVDPPRAGLHPRVVKTLRRCSHLNKILYLSCSPQSAQQNFLDLCRPESRKVKGEPYKLIKAIPVDLFPQTKLCELVMMFQREGRDDQKDTVADNDQTEKDATQ